MPKNKLDKYKHVKELSNVFFSEFGVSQPPESYPWYQKKYIGMEKVLELGCGKGEHSLAFAMANPARLFIGVDTKSYRICDGAQEAVARNLDNVLFLRGHIENIEDFFLKHTINEIWLTFPDPHLKNRRAKLRLSSPKFLDAYKNLLASGGKVVLKTDSARLFEYTKNSVNKWGGHIVAQSENIHGEKENSIFATQIVSAFENIAISKKKAIKYLAFQLS